MSLPPWMPELGALELLLSVAELGSVGRAALAHAVSQPTASARLSRLERRLGVALLARTSRGSTLTPAGEAVVGWARGVIDAAAVLADGVASLRTDHRARLRVAASLTIAECLLPTWLVALRRGHRDLAIAATVANSREVCASVLAGHADIGFVEAPEIPAGLHSRVIGHDRLVLLVPPEHSLGRSPRSVADLLTEPLLLREPGSGTRETFLTALARALGVEPTLPDASVLGSSATILATARAGGGVAIASELAARADLRAETLLEVAVDGLDLSRRLQAVWRAVRPSPLAAELLVIAQRQGAGA